MADAAELKEINMKMEYIYLFIILYKLIYNTYIKI